MYEDDLVMVILAEPTINPGLLRIMPRQHVATLGALGEGTTVHLFRVAVRMVEAVLKSGIKCVGTDLSLSESETSFRDHLYLWLLPRYERDERWLQEMFLASRDPGCESRRRVNLALWADEHGYDAGGIWPGTPAVVPPKELDDMAARIRDSYESLGLRSSFSKCDTLERLRGFGASRSRAMRQ
ncbi:MAG: hypothetical protein M3R69_05660 [Acidobacteriota bacterium]|nr:hypothetical protein [Acidobacteriota bacterium]